MDKNLHHIEDLFRSKLDRDEKMPPAKVWDQINNQLDREKFICLKEKYDQLRTTTIVVLFLLLTSILYILASSSVG